MKIRVFLQIILAAILGVFGFSCKEEGDEYGCPYANFEINGRVVNQKGEPLADVKVENVQKHYIYDYEADSFHAYVDTIENGRFTHYTYLDTMTWGMTDMSGNYDILMVDPRLLPFNDDGYLFRFVGDTTLYEPYDTIVPQNSIQYKGGDGNWYAGKAIVNIDVVLKEK